MAERFFDPLNYGAYHDGVRDDWLGWTQAAAAAFAAGGGVLVLSATPNLLTSLLLPTGVHVFAAPGCRATAGAGVTVTTQGTTFSSEPVGTVFAGAGTWSRTGPVTTSGSLSAATPQATADAGAAGATGFASDAGHVHPLGGVVGGVLSGTLPDPGLAAGAAAANVGTLGGALSGTLPDPGIAAGAATGAALGADVATLLGAQSLLNKTFDNTSNVPVKIYENTVVGTTTNGWTVAVPAGYRALRVTIQGRSAAAAAADQVNVEFNGDSGFNYAFQALYGSAAAATSSEAVGQSSIDAGNVAAASAPAGACGAIAFDVMDYANTVFWKTVNGRNYFHDAAVNAAGSQSGLFSGVWANTAAITSLKAYLLNGDFVAGSSIVVEAIP